MKTFAIFPTISVFIITFSLLKSESDFGLKKELLWSLLVTILFGVIMTIFSAELFYLLYYSNFLLALALIPFLTYLINAHLPKSSGKTLWIRLFAIGVISTALSLTLFGASMLYSFLNNPMDPAPRKEQNEIRDGDKSK